MRKLPDNLLNRYTTRELRELKRNILNYMVEFSSDDISWKFLNKEEMQKFLSDNYIINGKSITWGTADAILGMHYLHKYLYDGEYFIGTVRNKLNKETIVACIVYYNYSEIYDNVNYISTVEVNYFYQGRGLLKIMYENFVKELDLNKDIIITSESIIGKECHVIDNLKRVLKRNNFSNNVIIDE